MKSQRALIAAELRELADEAQADTSLGTSTAYVAFALRGKEIAEALRAAADEIDRLRRKIRELTA